MQETMIVEMEQEQEERSASPQVLYCFQHKLTQSTTERDKAAIEEGGDLLVENSNHTGGAWRPHHSDEEESSAEEEEVEEDSDFEVDALGNRIEKSL
jgi:hypothetical protein